MNKRKVKGDLGMPNYSNAVEEIKARCNIVDVIGSVVTLKRGGSSYMACCPFHNEKTPSFSVSESKQFYHCFGCGESGDVFSFVQKYYNISFGEAVEKLAAQYGVTIERENSSVSKKRAEMLEVNRLAARYYYGRIKDTKSEGYKYITGRGLTPETIKDFGLGYADDSWTGLVDYLDKNEVSKTTMVELGLASEKNGRVYDKYRNRLMFPIIDTRGKVIGFGGRIIGEGEPKYLNSQESSVFLKKNNLFGLNKAKDAIQEEGYAFLVEGYMDMVSLYQSGVRNVVASLGTALTENQAKLLKRYCSKVVLCYDADKAGIRAAVRGIDILRAADMEVKVLHVENAKDPDEYVKKFGKDSFMDLLQKKALDHVDYKVALIQKKYKRETNAQNVKFIKKIAEVLKALTPAEQEVYTKYLADKLSISEDTLIRETKSLPDAAPQPSERTTENETEIKIKPVSRSDISLERMLIKLSFIKSEYFKDFDNYEDAFVTQEGIDIADCFRGSYKEGTDLDPGSFRDVLSEEAYSYLNQILQDTIAGNDGSAYKDCIEKLEKKKREKRIKEIEYTLQMLDDMKDDERAKQDSIKLMQELVELRRIK